VSIAWWLLSAICVAGYCRDSGNAIAKYPITCEPVPAESAAKVATKEMAIERAKQAFRESYSLEQSIIAGWEPYEAELHGETWIVTTAQSVDPHQRGGGTPEVFICEKDGTTKVRFAR
jgi:hypothetical protein